MNEQCVDTNIFGNFAEEENPDGSLSISFDCDFEKFAASESARAAVTKACADMERMRADGWRFECVNIDGGMNVEAWMPDGRPALKTTVSDFSYPVEAENAAYLVVAALLDMFSSLSLSRNSVGADRPEKEKKN